MLVEAAKDCSVELDKTGVLGMLVQAVGFSAKTCNTLLRCECKRVVDILSLNNYRLKAMRGLGVKGRKEIVAKLEALGCNCEHLKDIGDSATQIGE